MRLLSSLCYSREISTILPYFTDTVSSVLIKGSVLQFGNKSEQCYGWMPLGNWAGLIISQPSRLRLLLVG